MAEIKAITEPNSAAPFTEEELKLLTTATVGGDVSDLVRALAATVLSLRSTAHAGDWAAGVEAAAKLCEADVVARKNMADAATTEIGRNWQTAGMICASKLADAIRSLTPPPALQRINNG